MATNLAISDELIREAQSVGQFKTKKEAVTTALEEFITRHHQKEVVDLFGKIEYDEGYDYKQLRNNR